MSYHYQSDLREMLAEIFGSGAFTAVFASILVAFFTFWLIFGAGYYVFNRIGLYHMAKNAGIPNCWLIFVPLANVYYMGLLAERSLYVSKNRRQPIALVYLVVNLSLWAISATSFFAGWWLVGAVTALGKLFLTAAKLYCLYYIYHDYTPENDILYTILGILPFATAILLLIYRNTVPVSVAGRVAAGQPKYNKAARPGVQPPAAAAENPAEDSEKTN